MSDEILWVMDSDICEQCDGPLNDFGICLDCGSDGYDWYEDDTEDWWEPDDEDEVVLERVVVRDVGSA